MADTRLPDVVPAKDLASGKETAELLANTPRCDSDSQLSVVVVDHHHQQQHQGGPSWHVTILNQDNIPVSNNSQPPIVQIWSGSNSPDSSAHPAEAAEEEEEEEESSRFDEIGQHRSASQLSDSGIDSQLASPTVIDGYNKLQAQSFVLDLSATHLSVPSRLRPCSLPSCQEKQQYPLKEDEPVHSAVESIVHGEDPSQPTATAAVPPSSSVSSASGFLPQKRHHRNFLPVDYSLDGWVQQQPASPLRSDHFQKIRSLPTESEQQIEMDETRLAASWSDSSSVPIAKRTPPTTSPQICVHRDIHDENYALSLDEHSGFSERSGSYDSNESSHFLADQETDPGSYCSSRKPSFSSVRSESGTENLDRRSGTNKQSLSARPHIGMLSRSSSSRSTFLSVPSRLPNSVWPSSVSDHLHPSDRGTKQSDRQPPLHSHLGSTSSLMASRFSLSNPYLRLGLTEAGINEALLASINAEAGTDLHYTADMFDDPYYCERAAAVAAQLSLTQRLAFPQLVESNPETSSNKPHSRYQQRNELPREESSLNFFAKIITFLVLVFVIVLVVGVLVKISHTPR